MNRLITHITTGPTHHHSTPTSPVHSTSPLPPTSPTSPLPPTLPSHPTSPLQPTLIQDAHMRVFHNGVKETLTEVRRKFWIVRGRSLTKAILFRCVVSKRYEGAPLSGPPAPPLPEFRVKESPAFTHTGVDFAGPIVVRSGTAVTLH